MRVGVTGLAAVVLIVTLATAIASGVGRSVEGANQTQSNVAQASNGAAEPLAQLGVAPGGSPDAPSNEQTGASN